MKDTTNPDFQSARRYSAICGLIEGKSLKEIAKECDISVRTLQRWMECPQFIEEYEKLHRQFLDRVNAKLQSAADKAAAKIIQLMDCGIPSVEMMAAKTVVRTTDKAKELNELRRLVKELQKANAGKSNQISRLQTASDQFEELKTQFKTCKLDKPKWMTNDNWDKLLASGAFKQEITVRYVHDHSGVMR